MKRRDYPGKYDAAFARLRPIQGVWHTQGELALMVGCTRGYISMIEMGALRKLRVRAPEVLAELTGRL